MQKPRCSRLARLPDAWRRRRSSCRQGAPVLEAWDARTERIEERKWLNELMREAREIERLT
jgi:hypothetical protein